MRAAVCLVLLLMLAAGLHAQDGRRARDPDFVISIQGGIPKPITSSMFSTSFDGIYQALLIGKARVFGKMRIGLGYGITGMQNNRDIFVFYQAPKSGAQLSFNTQMVSHEGAVHIGYEHGSSASLRYEWSLAAGMLFTTYTNVNNDTLPANMPQVSPRFSAPFLRPQFAVNLLADDNISLSFFLNYTTVLYNYNPKAPHLNQFEEVQGLSNSYFMSWIGFGFGFNYLIDRKRT